MSILGNIVKGLAPAATVAGNALQGYKIDLQDTVKRDLAEREAQRVATNDAISNRVKLAGIDPAIQEALAGAKVRGETPGILERNRLQIPLDVQKAGEIAQATAPVQQATHAANAKVDQQTHEINRKVDVANPLPTPAPNLIVTDIGGTATEPGKKVAVNPKTGEVVKEVGDAKAPTAGAGSAKMMQAVASNDAMVRNIDDAIASVRGRPGSFGLGRGIPLVGDLLDPRLDPEGVGPRAQVANIGSQKLHDRSGAAVTAAEFPRLVPFIPTSHDPAESIITKLEEMKKVILSENEAMRAAGAPAGAKPPAGGDADFDALLAKYKRPPA